MSNPQAARTKSSVNFDALFKAEYPPSTSSSSSTRRGHGQKVYVCLHCSDRWAAISPSNAVDHARRKHPELVVESQNSQLSSTLPVSGTQATPATQATLSTFVTSTPSPSSLRNLFNVQQYTDALVGLLTENRMPFSSVTWTHLKLLVLSGNPAIGDLLITSRYKAMKIIDSNYHLYLDQLKTQLQESRSMIHISTDLWTSPHRHAMLAVCAHWIDGDYRLRKALLAMPECQFNHSGETQAGLIMDVLNSFDISRIGYHIGDNASSNDTCLESLAQRLKAEHEVCWIGVWVSEARLTRPDRFRCQNQTNPMHWPHHQPVSPVIPVGKVERSCKCSSAGQPSC